MLVEAADAMSRVVSRLLSEDTVFALVQRGLSGTLVARRMFERNVVRMLSSANFPSRQDLDRLLERIDAIDRELDDILARVHGLSERMDKQGALQARAFGGSGGRPK